MKIWLMEYVVFHHRTFIVKHSDENKFYIVSCHRDCPSKDDSWRITSVIQHHMYSIFSDPSL
jgi:hypothetical protein